jgi:hypothetical protein
LKSLRLIRLIRIIKLYKYFLKSQNANAKKDDGGQSQSRKRKVEPSDAVTAAAVEPESLFRKETDPSKLGKALSDTNTREVIIGVLLMLMVLPLLAPTEIDFS